MEWCDPSVVGETGIGCDQNWFAATVIHEFAHRMDEGGKYSKLDSFRDLSGWRDEGSDPQKILDFFLANTLRDVNPFWEPLEGEELEIALKGALHIIFYDYTDISDIKKAVKSAYEVLQKDESGLKNPTLGYRSLAELTKVLEKSSLYGQILRSVFISAAKSPAFAEPHSDMRRQIHQVDTKAGKKKGVWMSYDNKVFSENYVSKYQFNNPGDDFSETIRAFFLPTAEGRKLPEARVRWIKANNLDKGSPKKSYN